MYTIAAVTGNAALDVLVGLFFLYFILSIVCSAANEGIAAALNLRAKDLERGVGNLLGGNDAHLKAFYAQPRIQALFKPKGGLLSRKPRAPSYISARTFALTLLDTLEVPEEAGDIHHPLARARAAVHAPATNEQVRGLLRDALVEARGDVGRLRAAIERSFDEVMDRATGWYKRRVQLILLAIAFGLVVIINADSFGIGQRLWKDDALRSAVVAQANQAVQTGHAACATNDKSPPTRAADCVDQVKALGIPFGWSHANAPHSFSATIGKIIGLLVTVFALSLGAPFWFDLLGKVANLRGSGPPTPGAETKAAT